MSPQGPWSCIGPGPQADIPLTVHETPLPGVLLIEPRVFADGRGFFLERYHAERYRAHGVDAAFVQDNHSRSRRGTLRGLHFQRRHPQGKLVECVRGAVYDVAVDLRRGSPTFGSYASVVLSDENHHMLWIPPGFAHGFAVISDAADVVYHLTTVYDPADDRGLLWSDPAVGITWPVEDPVLSDRDRANPPLSSLGDSLPLYTP